MLHLNKENFGNEIKNGLTIVDFWAEWCGPCKMLGPIFEGLEKEFSGKLKFAKVNVEENEQLSAEYSIRGIPCMILFKEGKEVDRIVGFGSAEMLKQKITEIISRS